MVLELVISDPQPIIFELSINASNTGGGSVSSVSVANANGFDGTVANPNSTPVITIETTVTGLIKGDGTAISAATANVDYTTPAYVNAKIEDQIVDGVTDKAPSQNAVFDADQNLQNQIDNLAAGTVLSVSGTSPIIVNNTDPQNPIVTIQQSGAIQDGYLSSADWNTFNNKQNAITPQALTKNDDTNVTLTLGGTPATALLQPASLTLGWTGVLAPSRGGTGVANTGTITLGGNLTTAGAFDATLTLTGNTNVTLPTTGTLATVAQLNNKVSKGGDTDGANLVMGTNDAFAVNIKANNTNRINILSNGNVGISTASPAKAFVVTGNSHIGGLLSVGTTDNNSAYMSITTTAANTAAIRYTDSTNYTVYAGYAGVANTGYIGGHIGTNFSLRANGAEVINLSNAGNVGIGVAPATEKLHVVGNLRLVNGSQGADKYLKSDANGVSSWATISAGDVGGGEALTKVDDTNVTLTLGGTPATSLLKATSLTLGWTGQLAIARGGTNASTALGAFNNLSPLTTLGDTLYHNGTNNVRLAGNTTITKQFLSQTGDGVNSAAPAWSAIDSSNISDFTEAAQDAVGAMVDTTLVYNDGVPSLGRAAISGDITISAGSNTAAITAGVIVNADINASAAIAVSKLAALTASRVVVTDASGFISASSVTTTTLGYLDATSSIQTQLNNKFTKGGDTNGSALSIGTNDSFDLTFRTNNTVRWTLDSSTGYLRRGTGSAYFGLQLYSTGAGSVITLGDVFDSTTPYVCVREYNSTDTDQIEIYGQKGAGIRAGVWGSTTPQVWVTQGGDVCINTMTPVSGAELTVSGDVDISSNANVQGTMTGALVVSTGQFTSTIHSKFKTATTPASPVNGTEFNLYYKSNKFIIQYNDGGTIRYKYLDLSGTGVTWVHTLVAP